MYSTSIGWNTGNMHIGETSKFDAYCAACKFTIKLGTMGIRALDSHMASEKHKQNINFQGCGINTAKKDTDTISVL